MSMGEAFGCVGILFGVWGLVLLCVWLFEDRNK